MSAYTGGIERLEAILDEAGHRMQYPPTPDFAPAVLARVEVARARPPRRLPLLGPVTPRLVLIILALLVLLACVATATYVVTQTTWLRPSARSVQFTDDFSLVELFRNDDVAVRYQNLALDLEGKQIYALGFFGKDEPELLDHQRTAIVRMSGLQEETVQTDVVLRFSDLRDAALWHSDVEFPAMVFPTLEVSVGSGGDVFFAASIWAGVEEVPEYEFRPQGPPTDTSVMVRHPDGTVGKVVTLRELVEAGLLGAETLEQRVPYVDIAPSAPGYLWLQVITLDSLATPPPYYLVRRHVYEVRDPNADGDWSDRDVARLTLPAFVAEERRDDCCPMSLLAEPSVSGPRSLLLTMRTPFPENELRVYRVSDLDGDGDLLDGGEFELIFAGVPPRPELGPRGVVPRVVVQGGKVVLRELVIGAFTTQTRVSRVTEGGEVIDIARAFSSIQDVLADTDGNIYVWAYPPDGSSAQVLYKLKRVLVK